MRSIFIVIAMFLCISASKPEKSASSPSTHLRSIPAPQELKMDYFTPWQTNYLQKHIEYIDLYS